MGITDLLKELPGGNAKTSTHYGFANLAILRSFLASIDTGTLLFVCALRHKDVFCCWRLRTRFPGIPAASHLHEPAIHVGLLSGVRWNASH